MSGDLYQELFTRFTRDQELSFQQKRGECEQAYWENACWLKEVVERQGWPTLEQVGEKGEMCVWLIVQHAHDLELQKAYLRFLEDSPPVQMRKINRAFLTDRILVKEGKEQVYGTQFSEGKPLPIADVEGLDARREEMHLEPFSLYCRRMKAYIPKV